MIGTPKQFQVVLNKIQATTIWVNSRNFQEAQRVFRDIVCAVLTCRVAACRFLGAVAAPARRDGPACRRAQTAFEAGSHRIFVKFFAIVRRAAQIIDNLVGRNEVIRQTF